MRNKGEKKKINKMAIVAVVVCLIAVISIGGIKAYYSDDKKIENKFKTGEIEVTITEPEYDKKLEEEGKIIVTPGETIVKDPTLTNSGSIKAYIRAQVYVPIYNIKTVNENEEIVENAEGVELFSYEINDGWEEVTDDGYSGIYEDSEGNKYKVRTYKYVENGTEKIIEAGETIKTPVFSSVTAVNYLDQDKEINTTIHIGALGVQTESGTADEMWTYYKNQNGTVILGIK